MLAMTRLIQFTNSWILLFLALAIEKLAQETLFQPVVGTNQFNSSVSSNY